MNIKTTLLNVLLMVIILIGYHFIFQKRPITFAYVDSSKLMTDYKGMADVKKIIESKSKVWQSSVDTVAQELQNDIKKYEKERSQMSERERKTTEELIGHKQQQFMQYKQASQNRAAEEEQKITNEALVKVNSIINDYGKTNNYAIIFGTVTGNIVYAKETINITDEVLEVLNKQYEQNKK